MKISILQPYFLPYISYFQLINSVDTHVIYDDVNYIKGGWINRNKILLNGAAFMVKIPVCNASSFKKINEIKLLKNNSKLIKTIDQAYRKAPFFEKVFPLLLEILAHEDDNLAFFNANSITKISNYLKIKTKFYLSSEIIKNNELKAQDRVIHICKTLSASEYCNPIGGQILYSRSIFNKENIDLKFLHSNPIRYKQYSENFCSGLSILDVMMFNSTEDIKSLLESCELV